MLPVPFSANIRFANPAPARRAAFSNLRLCRRRRVSRSQRPRSSTGIPRSCANLFRSRFSDCIITDTLPEDGISADSVPRFRHDKRNARHNRTRNSCVVAMRALLLAHGCGWAAAVAVRRLGSAESCLSPACHPWSEQSH